MFAWLALAQEPVVKCLAFVLIQNEMIGLG